MRIAFIGGFAFSPKGTIRARACPLAAELVRRGHEVTIFLTPYDNSADFGRHWEQDGVHIHNIALRDHPSAHSQLAESHYWFDYPSMLRTLIGDVSSFHPDLIHVFKPKGFAGAAGTYFMLRGNRSVVLDCDDWEGWGGWNDVKSYPWLVKQYIDLQERWMMRSAPVVTVASRALEQRARRARSQAESVYYIPNCTVDSEDKGAKPRFLNQVDARRRFSLPEGPIVFYSGHFEPGEDVMFFCAAAASAVRKCSASLVFVGEGPRLLQVRSFFREHSHINAFFFPQLDHAQFCDLVRASDIAAFPYSDDPIHRAKCSARIVDYMTLGKAVLTSAVGQNCEYIVDEESGLLARPNDLSDFSHKLELLLTDSHLRERLGQNAKERLETMFQWSGEPIMRCLAAYESALKQ